MDPLVVIGIASTLGLLALVVAQEVVRAWRHRSSRVVLRVINMLMPPLMIAFAFAASVRLVEAALRPSGAMAPTSPADAAGDPARRLERVEGASRTVTRPAARQPAAQPARPQPPASRSGRFDITPILRTDVAGARVREVMVARPNNVLRQFVGRLDRSLRQLDVASVALTRAGNQPALLSAYRVRGAASADLAGAFVASGSGGGRYHAVLHNETVGGRAVAVALHKARPEQKMYLYANGNTLFVLLTDDESFADEVLRTLP